MASTTTQFKQETFQTTKAGKPRPLYEDEYSKINDDQLIITWYFFPTAISKKIDIKDIKGVYFRKQSFSADFGVTKQWGMSFSPIWWASDMKRSCRGDDSKHFNVVVDCGDSTHKGFTTTNIDAFLSVIRRKIAPGTPIVNDLPC